MININENNVNNKNNDRYFTLYVNVGLKEINTIVIQDTITNLNNNKKTNQIYQVVDEKLEKIGLNKPYDYYLIHRGKILPRNNNNNNNNNNTLSYYEIQNNSTINLHFRIAGGANIFKLIIDLVKSLWEVSKIVFKAIIFIGKLLFWFAQLILWIFKEFLNPFDLINDLGGSVIRISRFVIIGFTDVIFGFIRVGFNMIFGSFFDNIWGWDYDTEKNVINKNGDSDEGDGDSKKKKGYQRCSKDGKICYNTGYETIPFGVIVSTILMPPLGLLMEFGITYWINIIICSMLTLMFYFPGLLYALIMLYC
jgi:uncharacterized membrane protein YqaE (UPF0057 family)